MKKVSLGLWLLATTLCVTGVACKRDRSDGTKRVTVRSTDDATKPIVDEDYRFKLEHPGVGWKLLGEKDIKRLTPDAVAGAINAGKVFAAVIIERAPDLELEPYARLLWENMPLENRKLEASGAVTFKDKAAYRYEISGSIEGAQFRYVNTIVLHQGFAYQILTGGNASSMPKGSTMYLEFINAFSFLPGKVKQRKSTMRVTSAQGIGWHLDKGTFESPAATLRVRVPKNWAPLVGAELKQINPTAEVGMINEAANAYIVVIFERVGQPVTDYKKVLTQGFRGRIGATRATEVFTTSFGDGKIAMSHYPGAGNPAMDYLQGVHCREQRCWQVLGWSFTGSAEAAMPAVIEAMSAFEILDENEVDRLKKEQQGYTRTQNIVGVDFAFRSGRYLNFSQRFSWTTPPGFWRVVAGQEARAVNDAAQLSFEDRSLGINGLIIAELNSDMEPAAYHNVVVANLTSGASYKERNRKATKVGGRPGFVSIGGLASGGVPLEYQVSTTVSGNRAVQIAVWGYPNFMKEHAATVKQLTDALMLQDDLKATVATPSLYISERHGFSIKIPSGEWQFRDQTPASIATVAAFPSWKNGKRFFGVLALTLPFTSASAGDDGDAWFTDFFDQLMRDQFAKHSSEEPTESQITVAGVKARRLTWKSMFRRTDAVLLKRDRTYYVLMIGGSSRDKLFKDIPARFNLR